jgi:quercetin dioxygenase-like cupin family protein
MRTRGALKTLLIALPLLLLGAGLGVGLDRVALAQQSGVKRTVLRRVDDPGAAAYEAVLAIAEIPPGAASGRHRHPGVEVGYVLEGTVLLQHEGRPDTTLKAGDSFGNSGVHNASNPGPNPARLLAVYLVEKGKPLAEPVP